MSRLATILLSTCLVTGCGSTTRYPLGPVVTSVQVSGNSVQVARCDLAVIKHGNEGLLVLFILLLPFMLLGGGSGFDPGPTYQPDTSNCTTRMLAFGGAQ